MNDFIRRIAGLSQKQLVLLATQLRSQLDKWERQGPESMAVVGMACRFPGNANDPDSYWKVLQGGIDAVREIPIERWDVNALYDRDVRAPGKISTRWAGLLEAVKHFDAEFFGVAPREAIKMDPQQRILLEVAWEALERAGIAASSLNESQTGVFIGISGNDYCNLQLADGRSNIDAYFASGNAHSVASGRLSYVLGLHGPCLSLDTACSSSLVAVHLAVRSLRQRECDAALAGGVNLILSPEITIGLSKSEMMAADGRCKAFDARADGFVRGEGCGIIVLKRLSDAIRNKDRILAVIRGSAINHDGKSNGLTAPNGPAQEAVIRAALKDAGMAAADIGYVECHGTGTVLGDPIEVRALGAVLGTPQRAMAPLWIGSVKANIGHLESAAGIAGLMKLILALQKEEIPPQLHFQSANPNIDWNQLPLQVPTRGVKWPAGQKRRLGAVSSFGFSGTNAHVIVEEAPAVEVAADSDDRSLHLLTLSAKSAAALKTLAVRYAQHLSAEDHRFANVCFTANTGRTHFKHRLALVADQPERARIILDDYARDVARADCLVRPHLKETGTELVFLFTGQGSQYTGMAKDLYQSQPLFREILDHCDDVLQPLTQNSLCTILFAAHDAGAGGNVLLHQTVYTQPALFALEYALARVWRSWGIEPTMVMGHSIGEYVAACVAGLFSLEDGLRLVARRAQLMQALPARGAMAAIFAEPRQVEELIAPFNDAIAIAAYNGPSNTVVSGAAEEIDALCKQLAEVNIGFRRLQVSQAFHSVLMEPMLAAYAETVAGIAFQPPQIDIVSNVTGEPASFAMLSDPSYWIRHTRRPVRFADSILSLHRRGCRAFLEVGPDPVLLGMAGRIVPAEETLWLPSLRKGQNDWRPMLQSLAALYVNGFDVDWNGFDQHWARLKVLLPTYPFERKPYWSGQVSADDTPADAAGEEEWRRWLYEFQWQEQSLKGRPARRAVDLPAVEAITDPLLTDLAALIREKDIAVYDRFFPRLEYLCCSYVLQAFTQLGWIFRQGARFAVSELAERTAIKDQHRRLLSRMLDILAEEQILRREGSGWEVVRDIDVAPDPARLLDQMRSDYPECHAELNLIGSCAGQMAAVMQGQSDPMALLFPGGSMKLVEEMYQSSRVQQFYNSMIKRLFECLADRLPRKEKLRILEIGAGTGGTTSHILPALSGVQAEYVYTDISEAFLSHAKRKFSSFASLSFRLLDIDADPQGQGFDPKDFDVIIAANVLHATPDIRRALSNIRSLLAPGGLLVMLEGVEPQRFSDLTVGLTSGWWHFSDEDLRPAYALLPESRWLPLLAGLGFGDVTFLPGGTAARRHPILAQQSVIIARCGHTEQKTDRTHSASSAPWLIFADDAGYGRRMVDLLEGRGQSAVVAVKGDAFKRLDDRHFALNPLDPGHCTRLFTELSAGGVKAIPQVLHMWAIDERIAEEESLSDLEAGQQRMCASVLQVIQMITAPGFASPPRLAIFTRNAQRVCPGDSVAGVAQGTLWGLGRVIAMEHPELRCVRIDLDGTRDGGGLETLMDELAGLDRQESQLALRNGRRYVLRLTPSPAGLMPAEPSTPLFAAEGGYLITGGLAGLGIAVAQWMAARGAGYLVLMGRSAPSDDSRKIIVDMENKGAHITIFQGDVADRESLEAIFDRMAAEGKPLRGIVHCAGTLDDGILLQQTWDRFRRAMRAKVYGAWNLHCLTRNRDLDFFVLFSSGAAFLGSSGQGNHASANAFMDALAHFRKAAGQPALTINWGAWSRIGAANREGLAQRIQTKGLGLIPPSDGLSVLGHLLQADSVQVGVLPIQWPELFGAVGDGIDRRVFAEFEALAKLTDAHKDKVPALFLEQLGRSTPGRRGNLMLETLQKEVCRCLGIDSRQTLDTRQPLTELGLDSLMAVELRNFISQLVQVPLPATLLFNYPSLGELVQYLLHDVLAARLEQDRHEPVEMIADQDKDNQNSLDDFSEEEMENLLREKLMNL